MHKHHGRSAAVKKEKTCVAITQLFQHWRERPDEALPSQIVNWQGRGQSLAANAELNTTYFAFQLLHLFKQLTLGEYTAEYLARCGHAITTCWRPSVFDKCPPRQSRPPRRRKKPRRSGEGRRIRRGRLGVPQPSRPRYRIGPFPAVTLRQ